MPITDDVKLYINTDYLPPYLPFVIGTFGFGLMLIASFMYFSKFLSSSKFAQDLAKTGQMTLTHYISHLTLGMILFASFTNKQYVGKLNAEPITPPWVIFTFALGYFILSFYFIKFWLQKFKSGPFETLMRKISGS